MSEILRVGIFPCTGGGRALSERGHRRKDCRKRTENTGQIKLHLETDVDVGTVDGRTPPQGETTIGNLVKSGTLGVRQFLVLHGF